MTILNASLNHVPHRAEYYVRSWAQSSLCQQHTEEDKCKGDCEWIGKTDELGGHDVGCRPKPDVITRPMDGCPGSLFNRYTLCSFFQRNSTSKKGECYSRETGTNFANCSYVKVPDPDYPGSDLEGCMPAELAAMLRRGKNEDDIIKVLLDEKSYTMGRCQDDLSPIGCHKLELACAGGLAHLRDNVTGAHLHAHDESRRTGLPKGKCQANPSCVWVEADAFNAEAGCKVSPAALLQVLFAQQASGRPPGAAAPSKNGSSSPAPSSALLPSKGVSDLISALVMCRENAGSMPKCTAAGSLEYNPTKVEVKVSSGASGPLPRGGVAAVAGALALAISAAVLGVH